MFKYVLAALFVTGAAALAFAQDWARTALEKSPRHQESVTVQNGTRNVHAFVVYPEVSNKVKAIVVIHENRGLTDWVRLVADRLAGEGYIAIAPDLLSGTAPNGGGTADFADADKAREGIYALKQEQVSADLNAVADYAKALPACDGTLAVVGFCWGGSQSFAFATNRPDLSEACVFYGTAPTDPAAIGRIACPVHGFYGGNDARVNATIPATEAMMKKAGKTYEPVAYDGAGHAFMRLGEEADATAANKAGLEAAWKRLVDVLKASGK